MKPTWNSVSREGQKIYSVILDTLGLYARSAEDLQLLADVFAIHDDEVPKDEFSVAGSKFAVCRTMMWSSAGPGTIDAIQKAIELLRQYGAEVEELEFPADLADLPQWHRTMMKADGRASFLPEYRLAKNELDQLVVDHVENTWSVSRAAGIEAFDNVAMARPRVDRLMRGYAAVLVPSVPDEAPVGITSTGASAFNGIWTVSCFFVVVAT